MKPNIIKADTAGHIVQFDKEDIYYVGEHYVQGVIYKNKEAFDEHQGVCYIPENGFLDEVGIDENASDEMIEYANEHGYEYYGIEGYTRDDIYAAVYNHLDLDNWVEHMEQEYGVAFVEEFIDECAAYVFRELDWQYPETFIQECDFMEDWKEYKKRHESENKNQ